MTQNNSFISNNTWCDFCVAQEIHSDMGMTPEYRKFSPEPIISRELATSKYFNVIVALGPLVEGNILIIPHDHITSMAQLGFAQMEELLHIKSQVRSFMEQFYTKPIFFEHGFLSNCEPQRESSNCIDHAHLHVLPNTSDFIDLIKVHYEGFQLPNYAVIREVDWTHSDYIFYESSDGECWIFTSNKFEHQYLRKLACNKLGYQNNWNWRKFPNIEIINKTVRTFSTSNFLSWLDNQ